MLYSLAPTSSLNKEIQIKTWQLFLFVLLANLLAAWFYNEHIVTREVYHTLLAEQMEADRIDEYFNFLKKLSIGGYFFQPFFLWLQITFFVLLIQMPLVLMFIDIPFHQLFRTLTYASVPMTALAIARILWLYFLEPSEISLAILSVVPFSIASFLDASQYPLTAYMVLNKFNLFEMAWCFIIYKGLTSTGKLEKSNAALLVLCIWTLLLALQWGITAYLNGVNG